MPRILALLLCLVFVFALLKIDNNRFKPQSLASWLPTIWLIYCASKPLAAWFHTGYVNYLNPDVSEGSYLDRMFLTILIGMGYLVLARRKINWSQIIAENKWVFILFLYLFISIAWSEYTYISFKRFGKATGSIVMSLIILTGPSPLDDIKMILRKITNILIPFSMLLAKYFPDYGVTWGRYSGIGMWVGVASSKNSLGALCMIAVIFLIWDLVERWKRNKEHPANSFKYEMIGQIVVLGLALILLKGKGGAYSATSLGVLFIGLISFFILQLLKTRPQFRELFFLSSIVIAFAFLLIWGIYSMNPVEAVISLTGRDTTLTGRTDGIWEPLFEIAMNNPILGVGFGGFWVTYMVFPKMVINEAHNGYLDVFLELGLVGLILLFFLIFSFLKIAIKNYKYDVNWGSLQITIIIMALVHNITESSLFKPALFIWNVLLFIVISASLTKNVEIKK